MYSITLGFAAYALFGSSLTTLFYLFRENIKKCMTSPHHLFTISDAFSSIFAGIIFLINHLNMNTTINEESDSVFNNLTKFNRDVDYFFKYPEQKKMENPINCEFNIIMNYGMFFIPFTNAFISLLGYSLHYIININRLDETCTKSIKTMKNLMNEKKIVREESNEPSAGTSEENNKDSDLENIISDNIKTSTLYNLKNINFNQSSKYKITLVNVIFQWLLPFLITIILHFGEYPKLSEERTNIKDDCIFTTNFPFDHCHSENKSLLSEIFTNSSHYSQISNNYIESNDSIQSNSQEIDNVVSNIYKLINNTLSENDRKNYQSFNTSDLWNITKFMETNFSFPQNEFVNEWKLFQDLEKNQTNLEFDNTNNYFQPIESEKNVNNYENSNLKTDILQNETNYNFDFNTKIVSKNDIYEDLVNKIKNGIQKVKIKDKLRVNRNMEIIFSNESQCLKNQCLISTNFLKIHLFILLFIIYFIPILTSTIINVCASYKFKQIKDKIETNCITLKIFTNFNKDKIEKKYKDNDEIKIKNISWFTEIKKSPTEEIAEEQNSSMKIEIIKEDELLKNILKNLETTEKFTKILKINLILAFILWTPLFMEVLIKVFLCMNIPNWLMDSSFLGAISFAIARNYLNINMIKLLKTNEVTKKDNSIHPSL